MAWTKAQSDRVLGEIMQRSQRDPAFRRLCVEQPAAAVKQIAGEELPAGFTVRFVDNSSADLTVVLPDPIPARSGGQELSDEELAGASGGIALSQTAELQQLGIAMGGGLLVKKPIVSCFAAGTPVLMGDGTTRPIEELEVGDAVLAYDEGQRRVVIDTVAKVMHHDAEPLHLAAVEGVKHDLLLTTNHHFYVSGQWRAIRDVALQTELYHYDPALREASPRRLVSLAPTGRSEPVYNLEVEHAHSYFAAGLLVHNGGAMGSNK